MSYRQYIVQLSPWWLDQFWNNKRIESYGDVMDELYTDDRNAAQMGRLLECDISALNPHGNNFDLPRIDGELDAHYRAYLATAWDVWHKSGSDQGILEAFNRVGITSASIIHWQTLMNLGIPTAFGGGYHPILGADGNGGIRYIQIRPDSLPGAVIVQQVSTNSALSIVVTQIPSHPPTVTITLAGNAMGASTSTAKDVINLIRSSDIITTYGIGADFTGTGLGLTAAGTVTLDVPIYTHFFIDIGAPNPFGLPNVWDGGTNQYQFRQFTVSNTYDVLAITGDPSGVAIVAVGSSGNIWFYDSDAGGFWVTVTPAPATFDLNAVSFPAADNSDFLVVGSHGQIYGGHTLVWTPISPPMGLGTTDLFGCFKWDTLHSWIVGANTSIYFGSALGWTQQILPVMTAVTLRAIRAFSLSDAWVVGDVNTVGYWNGMTWTQIPGPMGGGNLLSIWGSSDTNIWVTDSNGNVYQYNGTSWSAAYATGGGTSENGVFGGSNNVLFVGDGGKLNEWKIGAATPLPTINAGTSVDLNGIFGYNNNQNIWLVGDTGTIIFGTIAALLPQTLFPGPALTRIWLNSYQDAWAIGYNARLVHYDGATWTDQNTLPLSETEIFSIYTPDGLDFIGVGSNGFVIGNLGGSFNWYEMEQFTQNTLYGVSGSSYHDVWAVGENGTIFHFDGTTWFSVSSGTTQHLYAVHAITPSLAYAVGQGGIILQWDGGTWKPNLSPTIEDLHGVSGSSPPVAAGNNGVIVRHQSGITWTLDASPVVTDLYGLAIHDADGTGFSVGLSGTLLFYDGASWSIVLPPVAHNLYAICRLPNGHYYAVGDLGEILYYNGTTWVSQTSGVTYPLYAIGGMVDTLMFAGGSMEPMVVYNGTAWANNATLQHLSNLDGIWANAVDDMWIVGDRSVLVHWNGSTWTQILIPGASGTFKGVWAGADNDLYVVSTNTSGAYVWHFDGVIWTNPFSVTGGIFNDIWGSHTGDVWVAGENTGNAAVWHWDGYTWSNVTIPTIAGPATAITGYDSTHIYVVTAAAILQFMAGTWSTLGNPGGFTGNWSRIAVYGPVKFYACTNSGAGVIFYWDGLQWSDYGSAGGQAIFDLAVLNDPSGNVTIFGAGESVSISLSSGQGAVLIFNPEISLNTWDGGSLWDISPNAVSLLQYLMSIVRKFKASGTSCRFFRINIGGEWVTIPVGELQEIDVNGNYTDNEYLTNW